MRFPRLLAPVLLLLPVLLPAQSELDILERTQLGTLLDKILVTLGSDVTRVTSSARRRSELGARPGSACERPCASASRSSASVKPSRKVDQPDRNHDLSHAGEVLGARHRQ